MLEARASSSSSLTEAELAALTRDNPKGQLFEFCQRTKCGRPKLAIEQRDGLWGVAMRLTLNARELASEMRWASARTVSEQLAARDLLQKLAESEDDGEPGEWIGDDEAKHLHATNAKGALLEHCVPLRLTPTFDVRSIVTKEGTSFEGSAHVVLPDGREVWSAIRRGAQAKLVEQAVASSLLEQLREELAATPLAPKTDGEEASRDPRSVLNELRQKGFLKDVGYALERIDGPPHAPVFHMTGFIVRPRGERLDAESQQGPSKKECERRVAERLLERVRGR